MKHLDRVPHPDLLGVVAVTLLAALTAALHAPTALRLPAALAFLLLAPGWGFVRAVRLRSLPHETVLVVAVSVALDVLVSQATVAAGLFSVSTTLTVLGSVAMAGVATCLLARAAEVPA